MLQKKLHIDFKDEINLLPTEFYLELIKSMRVPGHHSGAIILRPGARASRWLAHSEWKGFCELFNFFLV